MSAESIEPTELQPGNRIHELASIVALLRRGGRARAMLASAIDHLGSAVSIVRLAEEDRLFTLTDASHEFIGTVGPGDLGEALSDVTTWLSEGLDIRSVLDDAYPANLRSIYNRPPMVTVKGIWDDAMDSDSIAVVGTRRASREGIVRAKSLTRHLVAGGFTVISGLARGIDTAAHEEALDTGGKTVAVLGTGIHRVYPPENRALAERIITADGAMISQYLPDQPPQRWTFPQRNIVMSGLSVATVVIEASHTSGARMQARLALEHGRTVFLPSSLVKERRWARDLVVEGKYGSRAIEVSAPEDVLGYLRQGVPDVSL